MKKEECGCDCNSFGVAGLVFSVLSIPFALFPLFGIVFAILGVVFALIQRKKTNSGWVTSALIISVIGIIASILVWVGYVAVAKQIAAQIQQMQASGALPAA